MSKTGLPGQITVWAIDKIAPYANNAKIHDAKQVEKIAKSIQEFGWTQPIVVDKNGVIIAGHGRRLAAIKLGFDKVPVWVRSDLTDDQTRALRLADNRVAIADIDPELLQKELANMNFDLNGIFDPKELEFLNADLGEYDTGAFVENIEVEVEQQAKESVKTVEAADGREVKIEKALGFKSISGADERHVARFMAQIEAEMKAEGAEAFMKFVRGVLETQS